MSLRWRKSGEVLCAAQCDPEPGDTYIDDRLHYLLAVELRVVRPDRHEHQTGRWHWINATRSPDHPLLDG